MLFEFIRKSERIAFGAFYIISIFYVRIWCVCMCMCVCLCRKLRLCIKYCCIFSYRDALAISDKLLKQKKTNENEKSKVERKPNGPLSLWEFSVIVVNSFVPSFELNHRCQHDDIYVTMIMRVSMNKNFNGKLNFDGTQTNLDKTKN